jgi:hypothetical protein
VAVDTRVPVKSYELEALSITDPRMHTDYDLPEAWRYLKDQQANVLARQDHRAASRSTTSRPSSRS